jgi:hypothetical protein
MKQAATFKIETSFNLTRLGVTAYGRLIEGKILPGYFTAIDINGQQAKTKIKDLGMAGQMKAETRYDQRRLCSLSLL